MYVCRSAGYHQNRAAGVLGSTTTAKALACLQNCPLLADLAEFSHWDLVFKPEHKDLKTFVQKHGLMYQLQTTGMFDISGVVAQR